ncbi:MAG: tRNA (adenosine(37)-N6)-threonylcarbamoyltransferase complex ATPase subunit type 1 TsaE [Thiobacillus sp.]
MHAHDDSKLCNSASVDDESRHLMLADEAATLALGADIARGLRPGITVYLQGDLGAGKTTLVRGMLRALGYAGRVKSPTYTLAEIYNLPTFELYHFDLYRMNDPREWMDAGFREVANGNTVSLVEWPEKAAGLLPPPDLRLLLQVLDDGRQINLVAETALGKECLNRACAK